MKDYSFITAFERPSHDPMQIHLSFFKVSLWQTDIFRMRQRTVPLSAETSGE